MDSIKQRQLDLAASLWTNPGTFEDLKDRDFLKGISEYSLDRLISWCESDGLIYEKSGKYYCYRKTVLEVLNPAGYGLE